jgi:hypothetical protein
MINGTIGLLIGAFIGSSLGVFLMALAVTAKRADEELEKLGTERPVNKHWERMQAKEDAVHKRDHYPSLCRDCKHYIRSERRCNYGDGPLSGCGFERREDEIDGSVPY